MINAFHECQSVWVMMYNLLLEIPQLVMNELKLLTGKLRTLI